MEWKRGWVEESIGPIRSRTEPSSSRISTRPLLSKRQRMRKGSVCERERARVIPSFKSLKSGKHKDWRGCCWVCCSVLKRLIHRLDGESMPMRLTERYSIFLLRVCDVGERFV
jgi:hypothetical protein